MTQERQLDRFSSEYIHSSRPWTGQVQQVHVFPSAFGGGGEDAFALAGRGKANQSGGIYEVYLGRPCSDIPSQSGETCFSMNGPFTRRPSGVETHEDVECLLSVASLPSSQEDGLDGAVDEGSEDLL